jgi:serine/threonine-protein kinase
VLGGLITADVLDDRGIIQPLELSRLEAAAALGIAQFVFAIAYLMARGHRRATLRAMEQLDAAARVVAQREALLYEAKQELDRALKVGGPGRFTDQVLGEFRLGVLIGRGAMGEVYEATHEQTGELVAVKLLSTAAASDPNLVQRFLREVQIASSVRVPNVVRVIDAPLSASTLPYLAMERLRGETLAEVLRAKPRMDASAALVMLEGIAAGVDAAHEAGVVHRDLKPRNMFRHDDGGKGIWKILDFGISKLTSARGTLTQNQLVGTPAYMAPEQARGDDVDELVDTYALGVVAYRALTGRPAFTGKDAPSILYMVTNGLPPRPSTVAPLDPAIDDVLAVAIAKDPQDRFDSAAALVDALRAATAGELDDELARRARRITSAHPWGSTR